MTEPATTLLSVRGDARVDVPPDLATLTCALRTYEASKAEALQSAAAALDSLLADLGELGGVALAAGDERRPLAWTAYSATTQMERDWSEQRDRPVPTGRIIASVALRIEVRDFELLTRLGAMLALHGALHVEHVEWSVDADNPAWPTVRAAAIAAAVLKGRDYAGALGGSLQRIEHVADVGLLGGGGERPELQMAMAASGRAFSVVDQGGEAGEAPSLDPVPQELQAVIEARFTASVGPLA